MPPLKVLFFDVFGTCVSQEPSIADELHKAAQEALQSEDSLMSDEVRARAERMTYDSWLELAREWNREEGKFVRARIAEHNSVDWTAVDKHRIDILPKLLKDRGLIANTTPQQNSSSSSTDTATQPAQNNQTSLWPTPQIQDLGRTWHRLQPWPDTRRGLELLNQHFTTAALSNASHEVINNLVAHNDDNLPFQQILCSAMFDSYKPNAKVYLGAAEKLGADPRECALVAAHLGDLKGAKACGFYTVYVERPREEKSPDLKGEVSPDLWVGEGEGGFVAVAERLMRFCGF